MAGVSDSMLDAVDEEVHRIADECLGEARRLLKENRARLDAVVERLLERETLDEEEVYAVAGLPRPTRSAEPVEEAVISAS
jgi:cell division protease FtsH